MNRNLCRCKLCDLDLEVVEDLKKHLTVIHEVDSHVCEFCKSIFYNANDLHNHFCNIKKKKSTRHQCPICDSSYLKKYSLRKHIESRHNKQTGPLKCQHCGEVFFNNYFYKLHVDRKHGPQYNYIKCKKCDRSFLHKNTLTRHYRFDHATKGHQYLRRYIKKKIYLEDQSLLLDLSKCSACNLPFSCGLDLIKHLKLNHAVKKWFHCDQCKGTTYRTNAALGVHMFHAHGLKANHQYKQRNNKMVNIPEEKRPLMKPQKRKILANSKNQAVKIAVRENTEMGKKDDQKINSTKDLSEEHKCKDVPWARNIVKHGIPSDFNLLSASKQEVKNLRTNIKIMFNVLASIPPSQLKNSVDLQRQIYNKELCSVETDDTLKSNERQPLPLVSNFGPVVSDISDLRHNIDSKFNNSVKTLNISPISSVAISRKLTQEQHIAVANADVGSKVDFNNKSNQNKTVPNVHLSSEIKTNWVTSTPYGSITSKSIDKHLKKGKIKTAKLLKEHRTCEKFTKKYNRSKHQPSKLKILTTLLNNAAVVTEVPFSPMQKKYIIKDENTNEISGYFDTGHIKDQPDLKRNLGKSDDKNTLVNKNVINNAITLAKASRKSTLVRPKANYLEGKINKYDKATSRPSNSKASKQHIKYFTNVQKLSKCYKIPKKRHISDALVPAKTKSLEINNPNSLPATIEKTLENYILNENVNTSVMIENNTNHVLSKNHVEESTIKSQTPMQNKIKDIKCRNHVTEISLIEDDICLENQHINSQSTKSPTKEPKTEDSKNSSQSNKNLNIWSPTQFQLNALSDSKLGNQNNEKYRNDENKVVITNQSSENQLFNVMQDSTETFLIKTGIQISRDTVLNLKGCVEENIPSINAPGQQQTKNTFDKSSKTNILKKQLKVLLQKIDTIIEDPKQLSKLGIKYSVPDSLNFQRESKQESDVENTILDVDQNSDPHSLLIPLVTKNTKWVKVTPSSTISKCKIRKKRKSKITEIGFPIDKENFSRDGDVSKTSSSQACVRFHKEFKTSNESNEVITIETVEHTKESAKQYNCIVCNVLFLNEVSLLNHLTEKHAYDDEKNAEAKVNQTVYKCIICSAGFRLKDSLDRHRSEEHALHNKFKCDKCDAVYLFKYHLKQHVKFCHNLAEKDFQCEICHHLFSSQWLLSRHECNRKDQSKVIKKHLFNNLIDKGKAKKITKRKIFKNRFTCKSCKLSFKNGLLLFIHNKYKHNVLKVIPKCQKCCKKFSNKSEVLKHICSDFFFLKCNGITTGIKQRRQPLRSTNLQRNNKNKHLRRNSEKEHDRTQTKQNDEPPGSIRRKRIHNNQNSESHIDCKDKSFIRYYRTKSHNVENEELQNEKNDKPLDTNVKTLTHSIENIESLTFSKDKPLKRNLRTDKYNNKRKEIQTENTNSPLGKMPKTQLKKNKKERLNTEEKNKPSESYPGAKSYNIGNEDTQTENNNKPSERSPKKLSCDINKKRNVTIDKPSQRILNTQLRLLKNEETKCGSNNTHVRRNLRRQPHIVKNTETVNDTKKYNHTVNASKTGSLTYKCISCKLRFWSEKQLAIHMKREHILPKRLHKCLKCSSKFLQKPALLSHIKNEHNVQPYKIYKCDLCNSVFKFQDKLKQHYNFKHQSSSEKKDPTVLNNRKALPTDHSKINTPIDDEHSYCTSQNSTASQIVIKNSRQVKSGNSSHSYYDLTLVPKPNRPIITSNIILTPKLLKGAMYRCLDCGAYLPTNDSLQRHKLWEHTRNLNLQKCAQCGLTLYSVQELEQHMMTCHENFSIIDVQPDPLNIFNWKKQIVHDYESQM